ncbi:hypothetical protein ARMGADRAFT_5619 [Armillaria gallica]|uniref:Uncharacterized protein n=1 Tax=Armillaria gallica TaxID=47427 RepID=A0A2H3E6W0_ARMGA|nr:hypothetical protein ARMGADRAFT_5619 [Armillaria gallica]
MALAALKTELRIWNAALAAHDAKNFAEALVLFQEIADTARIWVNMGLIQRRMKNYNEAVKSLTRAIALDPSLVLACVVSPALLQPAHCHLYSGAGRLYRGRITNERKQRGALR